MAGQTTKKRPHDDAKKSRGARPTKKQRQALAYDSSSSASGDEQDNVPPPNLLDDSEEDLEEMQADDVASGSEANSSDDGEDGDGRGTARLKVSKPQKSSRRQFATDAPPDGDADGDQDADSQASGSDSADDEDASGAKRDRRSGADSAAFSTSMAKMLSAKLSTSRRADPIVARSAETAAATRQAMDAALESKARRRLREQKRLASEKGRVRDVLMPSRGARKLDLATGAVVEEEPADGETTAQVLATERALRKVAQRGVVQMYNAIFAAQVKAAEAERELREKGVIGAAQKEEKVTEMSRKGFLDLIASGGGGLKKGRIEEA